MPKESSALNDTQRYDEMYRLTRRQFELSRDLHTLADSQLRMVMSMTSHHASIGKAVAGIAANIKQVTDQLCALRDEMRALYPEQSDAEPGSPGEIAGVG